MKRLFGLFLVTASAPIFIWIYYSGASLIQSETKEKEEVEEPETTLVSSTAESIEVELEEKNSKVSKWLKTLSQDEKKLFKDFVKENKGTTWKNMSSLTEDKAKEFLEKAKKEQAKQKKATQTTKKTTSGYQSNVQEDNYRSVLHPYYH